jgi:hypothetical protein
MPRKKKILYTKTALRICGIAISDKAVDLVIRVVRLVEYEQGKTDLQGLAKVIARNNEKYPEKEIIDEQPKNQEQ